MDRVPIFVSANRVINECTDRCSDATYVFTIYYRWLYVVTVSASIALLNALLGTYDLFFRVVSV
jgi:hypothetical protein